MQQKNGDVLVSTLRQSDLITEKWPLWVLSKGDSVVTGPMRTTVKTEQHNTSVAGVPALLSQSSTQAWSCSLKVLWSMSRPISTSWFLRSPVQSVSSMEKRLPAK